MVVVASSRSARTALPREQNHPGRRFEHAAQPTGDCRLIGFCAAPAKFPLVYFSHGVAPSMRRRSAIYRSQLSDLGEGCIQVENTSGPDESILLEPSVQELGYFRCDEAHVYQ